MRTCEVRLRVAVEGEQELPIPGTGFRPQPARLPRRRRIAAVPLLTRTTQYQSERAFQRVALAGHSGKTVPTPFLDSKHPAMPSTTAALMSPTR